MNTKANTARYFSLTPLKANGKQIGEFEYFDLDVDLGKSLIRNGLALPEAIAKDRARLEAVERAAQIKQDAEQIARKELEKAIKRLENARGVIAALSHGRGE